MGGKVLELESDKLIEQGLSLEDWKIKWTQPVKNVASGQVYD